MKHLISVDQVSDRSMLDELISRAERYRKLMSRGVHSDYLANYIIATLFYEPSTRTRLSFESAALRLGAQVISTESASQFSSAAKGETLEDSIRVVSSYCDAIVIRHPEVGSAKRASEVSSVPIINAGDGQGEHPSQALLDLYTIQQERGKIDGCLVTMVGDLLNGRTVHSLAKLLPIFNDVRLTFVSPRELAMPRDLIANLSPQIACREIESLQVALEEKMDILYVTRLQRERFASPQDYARYENLYTITPQIMSQMKDSARVLHPLPRINEIDSVVDNDPRAAYFRQAENGLYMRMAILDSVLSH